MGTVRLSVFKGQVYVLGRESPRSLYNEELVRSVGFGGARVGRGGGSNHLTPSFHIPSQPVTSHPDPSHPIASHPIPSHPTLSHPIPSYSIPSPVTPAMPSSQPSAWPKHEPCFQVNIIFFSPLAFPFSLRCFPSRSLASPPALPQPLSISLNTL